MGFEFLCESCGKRLTVPPGLYEKKVRGRVVTIGCKSCGAPIRIDATLPPPPVEEKAESAPAEHSPAIPKAGRMPEGDEVAEPFGSFRPPVFTSAPPSSGEAPPDSEVDAGWDESSGAAAPSSLPPDVAPTAELSQSAAPTEPPQAQGRRALDSTPPLAAAPEAPFLPSPPPTVSLTPSSDERGPVPSSEPTRFDGARPMLRSPEPEGAPAEELFSSTTPSGPTHPEGQSFADESSLGEEVPPISHVSGPISARAPIAKLGRYMLFDKFASGGMATVHLGRLDGAGGFSRVVAIKRLLPHLVQSGEFSEMLLNEARLAARVRHPNVVPTLDVVASKGEVLLVLEYVHGESLSALCRTQAKQRGVVPVGVAVSIVLGLLQGLHAVHEATDERGRSLGLVHRDVSPQNVMVGVDGMARVLDFGIVKALEQIEETVPNRLKGKTGYMSPEQIRGERVTRSSDIFAAGIVLWEMLTLRRFSSASTDRERLEKIMSGNYARPGSHRLDLSSTLDEIVMRALSFDAKDRYATAREFADALSRSGEGVSSSQVADWVQRLAEKTLLERARLLAQVENWDDGSPEIELSSTPFAVEKDDLDTADTTGEHSPRPPGVRGSRASRPTPVPAAVAADDAPVEPRAANALPSPAAPDALASVSGSLQPLFEHPLFKPLFQHLPDPRARVGVVAGTLFLLLFLLYLLVR
jgi:serine/threonine-protein kinase